MSLTQAEGQDAQIDRIVRGLVVHCGLRTDNLTATEHAARAELASRLLDAAGDESALDLSNPPGNPATRTAFVAELLNLSLRKTLT